MATTTLLKISQASRLGHVSTSGPKSAPAQATSGRTKQDPRTVDELIRLRAQRDGNHDDIIAYPDSGTAYIGYSPVQLDALVENAAVQYCKVIPQRLTSDQPVQVVALLGVSDLDYLIAFLAVLRLGHTALLLSTRITTEAYQSLVTTTKATVLLHGTDFRDATAGVQARGVALDVAEILNVKSLSTNNLPQADLDFERETHNISFIIHSSGSTGLPKPIYQTHKAALYSYSQNFGLAGHITLPLYHNHGISCLFRAIYSGRKLYIYNARLPLTAQHLLATLREHPDIKILYGVPYALKLLAESDEGVSLLSRLDIVMFGGSACPKPIGDALVARGVNLVGHYGATEVGQLMTSFRDFSNDEGWDWLRVPTHLKPFLGMEKRGAGLYELVVQEGWPSKVVKNREDGAYASKDLFEPHPTIPDAWRYYARSDDTLAMENGEKANTLVLEGALRQHKHVAEAIVFGAGKPRLGAFIIPAANTQLSHAELIDVASKSIEDTNKSVPAFAQLSPDMIHVLPPDVSYRCTDKGTVIRAAFYKDFAERIDAAYVDATSGTAILPRSDLIDFLRYELQKKLGVPSSEYIKDDADLFAIGVDSLRAIQLRSLILKRLKVNSDALGRNFVFDFPTLNQIADEILRLQQGYPVKETIKVEDRMTAMIDKYASFQPHRPVQNTTPGRYLVVTGATGSLGAHAVYALAKLPSISKIYCLIRADSQKTANNRLVSSLRQRCLDHRLLPSERSKITSLVSDLGDPWLGLEPDQYNDVAENLTGILHLAWSVNFNKALESFEKDCVAGVKNLITLALHAKRAVPATFNYCSSVSATVRTPGADVPEALPVSLSYAQGMGYAQSKLVAEHLCDRAAKLTGIQARVLRVGQIFGDTKFGIWNNTEAIPMIFQTAKTVGALPQLDEYPSWLPVDIVAKTCVEITCSDADSGVFNVVNHHSFHWSRDLLPLLRSSGLEFEEVSQREWIRRLRESDQNPTSNPPIKLVDFFASKYDNDQPRESLKYQNDRAQAHSPALQQASRPGASHMRKIVLYLQQSWSGPTRKASPKAIVICGPCGSGKSTVAASLSQQMSLPLIEGDDMHSLPAREKMRNGHPLSDGDRLEWLGHLRGAIMDRTSSQNSPEILVTCSALKRSYRDELRRLYEIAGIQLTFIILGATERSELMERMNNRKGHYMCAEMVDSQMEDFEWPHEEETDVFMLDAMQPRAAVLEDCQEALSSL